MLSGPSVSVSPGSGLGAHWPTSSSAPRPLFHQQFCLSGSSGSSGSVGAQVPVASGWAGSGSQVQVLQVQAVLGTSSSGPVGPSGSGSGASGSSGNQAHQPQQEQIFCTYKTTSSSTATIEYCEINYYSTGLSYSIYKKLLLHMMN